MPLTLINFYIALDGHFSGDMSFCNPLLMCEKLGSNDEQCKNRFYCTFFHKAYKNFIKIQLEKLTVASSKQIYANSS